MDIRQVLNTPTKPSSHGQSLDQREASPSAKRDATPPNNDRSSKTAKTEEQSHSVYILFSKQWGKHIETEVETHGVYSCKATAINAADRMVRDAQEDRLYYNEVTRRSSPAEPFFASFTREQYIEQEIWVEAHLVDDTVEDLDERAVETPQNDRVSWMFPVPAVYAINDVKMPGAQ